jgi:predicted glycoside hydrolase/deacetylase ChbG (UPF0249 family)
MKQVIVNADDFGICTETNLAIEFAYRRGILTSASLMPNMPGFDHAVGTVLPRNPGLGLGVHLVLTSGHSVADPRRIPLLVDTDGLFRRTFLGLLALTCGPRSVEVVDQIEHELDAQFEKVRSRRLALDHVNSHQHVHMIPTVWEIVVRLAARNGSPVVRLGNGACNDSVARPAVRSRALRGNILKRVVLTACGLPTRGLAPAHPVPGIVVRHPDNLATEMSRKGMDRRTLTARLASLPEGVTEIVTHPSLASTETVAMLARHVSREDLMFLSSPGRRLEFEALMDGGVRAMVSGRGITLASFGTLSGFPLVRAMSHAH